MKMDVSLTVVERTSDILSEMESLMILGGSTNDGDKFTGNCDKNTYFVGTQTVFLDVVLHSSNHQQVVTTLSKVV